MILTLIFDIDGGENALTVCPSWTNDRYFPVDKIESPIHFDCCGENGLRQDHDIMWSRQIHTKKWSLHTIQIREISNVNAVIILRMRKFLRRALL